MSVRPENAFASVPTWALLAALYHRDVGEGDEQTIDVSLCESVCNTVLYPLGLSPHHHPAREVDRLPRHVPGFVGEQEAHKAGALVG